MQSASWFQKILSAILAAQIGLGASLPAFAGDGDKPAVVSDSQGTGGLPEVPFVAEIRELLASINSSDLSQPVSLHADPFHLVGQFERTFDKATGAVLSQNELARTSIMNERVGIADPNKQIRYKYDAEKKEFIIELDQAGIIKQHVIPDMNITSNIVECDNFVIFATDKGVHVLLKYVLYQYGNAFTSPVPLFDVLPSPPAGAITRLDFISPLIAPLAEPGPLTFLGDLQITAEVGTATHKIKFPRAKLTARTREWVRVLFGLTQLADPNIDDAEMFTAMVSEDDSLLQRRLDLQSTAVSQSYDQQNILGATQAFATQGGSAAMRQLLQKDGQGLDAFQRLINAPREAMTPEEWKKLHEQANATLTTLNLSSPGTAKSYTWSEVREAMVALNKQQGKQDTKYLEYFSATQLKRLGMALSGAYIGGTVANAATDGAFRVWAVNICSKLLELTTHVPVLKYITDDMYKHFDIFKGDWSVATTVGGIGVVLMLYPLTVFLGSSAFKMTDRASSLGRSAVHSLLNFGTKLYAIGNYPFQRILFWDRFYLNQRIVYPALEAGINPWTKFLDVFHWPWASDEAVKAKAAKLDAERDQARRINARAALLAGAIIAGESEASIMSIMQGDGDVQERVKTYQTIVSREELRKHYMNTADRIAAALSLRADGANPVIDRQALKEIIAMARKEESYAKAHPPGAVRNFAKWASKFTGGFVNYLSTDLVFGASGMKAYKDFRYYLLDEKSAEIAAGNYTTDYLSAATVFALASPYSFSEIITTGGTSSSAKRMLFENMEGNFAWTTNGPVDATVSAQKPSLGTPDEFTPLAESLYDHARKSTLTEDFKTLIIKSLDPESKGFFETHQQYLTNLWTGKQMRMITGAIGRVLFMVTSAELLAAHHGSIASVVAVGLMMQAFFLLHKTTLQPNGAGGYMMGYAVIWPHINLCLRYLKDAATGNLNAVKVVDYFLDMALKTKDMKHLAVGVGLLQDLYVKGKTTLPERFMIESDNFSLELAREFLDYSRKAENVPLATVNNKDIVSWNFALNFVVGVIGTTVLANILSLGVYGLKYLSPEQMSVELAKGMGIFVGSYAVLGGLSLAEKAFRKHVGPTLIKMIQDKGGSKCEIPLASESMTP